MKLRDDWSYINLQLDPKDAEALYWLLALGEYSADLEPRRRQRIGFINRILQRLDAALNPPWEI